MKRHLISQGTIVVLTVLIAVMLGMINPSTVLGAKPLTEYTDVVKLHSSDTSLEVSVTVKFWQVGKSSSTLIGGAYPSCGKIEGTSDADCMFPVPAKPSMWELWVKIWDEDSGTICFQTPIESPDTGTNFPATLTFTCGEFEATITIGSPRVFP